MNRNEEPRVLRLEAELNRLEARLASDEARAAQLEQTRPNPGPLGTTVAPVLFPFVMNATIFLNGLAAGAWGGTTVSVFDGTSTLVGTGMTDNWGYCSFYFFMDRTTEVGQVYTYSAAHAAFTTDNQTVTIVAGAGMQIDYSTTLL